MTTRTDKTLACVRMKDEAQQALAGEYERRKSEFPSYDAFLDAKAAEDPWIRKMRARFADGAKDSGK